MTIDPLDAANGLEEYVRGPDPVVAVKEAPHVIVVTEVPAPPDEPDAEPEFESKVECPGVTDSCRTWWECTICADALAKDEDDSYRDRLDENSEAHGVEHRLMEFGWAAPSQDCWAQVADDRPDAIEDVFRLDHRPMTVGRYPVVIGSGDPLTFAFAALDGEVTG